MCRPIICVCNDLFAQVMRPLRDVAAVFQFKQPSVRIRTTNACLRTVAGNAAHGVVALHVLALTDACIAVGASHRPHARDLPQGEALR